MLAKVKEIVENYYRYLYNNHMTINEDEIKQARKIIQLLTMIIQLSSKPRLIRQDDSSFEEQLSKVLSQFR